MMKALDLYACRPLKHKLIVKQLKASCGENLVNGLTQGKHEPPCIFAVLTGPLNCGVITISTNDLLAQVLLKGP